MSTESLKELLSDMTSTNQIEIVDFGYKIKENVETDYSFDDDPNFVKNTQINHTNSASDSATELEIVIIPETRQTLLLISDLPITLKRPIKSKEYGNTQTSISLQNMFLKETEKTRTFTKLVERKFEAIENFITNLSVSNNVISTQVNTKSFCC